MKKDWKAFDEDGMRAPAELRRICVKVANQAGKGQWWNAMAAATELVRACQEGCRSEIERVAKARSVQRAPRRART